ncbi:MAG: hypothetical protein ACU83V_03965 [Gammaproteobacteria bacterium]
MAILDSIAIEIQATIAGVLILLIITLLQIIDLQRARKQHRLELQEMSIGMIAGHKKPLLSPFSLILRFIFGFAAFGLFVCGMMYLIIIGKMGLAVVAGGSAFVAVMMPFILWSVSRSANKETDELLSRIQQRRQEPAPRQKTPETPAAPIEKIQAEDRPAAVTKEPAVKQEASVAASRPVPSPQPKVDIAVRHEVFPTPDPAHVFPQDSMLRRHFMTHLAASAKSYVSTRPTDSMLRRHYDAMVSAQPVAGSKPSPAMPAAVISKPCCRSSKSGLPEDSMLRRHFVTTLRATVESRLQLPSRPTDAMLRRHYDAMKENLIACELKRHLEG